MPVTSRAILPAVLLLGISLAVICPPRPAAGSDFTAFAQDEDVCRKAGSAAIGGASGLSAEQSYDATYQRCMQIRGRRHWIGAHAEGGPPGARYGAGNPHSFDYPDAFYSIPYATPGYGYDGFGY